MKRIFVLLVITLIYTSSCIKKEVKYKRYEEDPADSKVSPFDRLKGQWSPIDYSFNGKSIIPQVEGLFKGRCKIRDGILISASRVDKDEIFNLSSSYASSQYFNFNNEDSFTFFFLTIDSVYMEWLFKPLQPLLPANNYTFSPSVTWRITKLYDKSLNIVLPADSGTYKISFEKIY